MPTVDFGVDYEDVKDQDEIDPMPNANYEFQVVNVEQKRSSKGRPMLVWTLEIINNEEFKGRKLFNNTVLAWVDPATGERDINVFGLVAQCKAIGVPWQGGTGNTEDFLGRTGVVKVKQVPRQTAQLNPDTGEKEWVDDPEAKPVNKIDRFVY